MNKQKIAYLLQLSSGRGPVECEMAVGKLRDKIEGSADQQKVTCQRIDETAGQQRGAYSSVVLEVSGLDAQKYSEGWLGTIQWVCESPYRRGAKRKNWFVGVSLLDENGDNSQSINNDDLVWKTVKASGPGGQHVNKTDSAVQLTHKPTGIQVRASSERSQHANKKTALEKLETHLKNIASQEEAQFEKHKWSENLQVERGSPVKVFYGMEFKEK